MAKLSNEYTLDLTQNDIIAEAYDLLQVAADGESTDGDLFNRAHDSLNLMMKLWQSQGIHLWTFTEGSLFLQVGQASYDYRDEGYQLDEFTIVGGTHLTNAFTQHALDGALETENTNEIVLVSAPPIQPGYQIGWVNNDNDLVWRVVTSIAGGNVGLSGDVASEGLAPDGAVVYAYPYFYKGGLAASASSGQPVVEVEASDTPFFSVGDETLLLLDSGGSQYPLEIAAINEATNEITFTEDLADSANFTTLLNLTTRDTQWLPVSRISEVRRRESTDYEIPIVFQSRKDYFDLPNKEQQGNPIQAYYDRQQPTGVMYLWNPPSNATPIINFTYERNMMVFTNDPDETFDFPAEWFDAIAYNLAKRMIPKVGCSEARKMNINEGAAEYLANALAFDQAVYPIRLKPEKYG